MTDDTRMNFELIALLLSFALIFPTAWTNISYAQFLPPGAAQDLLPPNQSPGKQVLPNAQISSNIHAVNIISPTKGQQIPIGKDLIISGTSLANATSNCQIIVGLNNIKPYQPATGNGPGGAQDYSKWNFVLTSKYAMIKQGPDNKITARYKCSTINNNPNIVSINSVNITGLATTSTNQLQQQLGTIENNTTTTNSQPTGIPWLP